MTRIAKFYKTAAAGTEGDAFVVRLDGKPVKTPGRKVLVLPTKALAEAIAEEWQRQADQIDPETMPLTRLAFAAVDIAPGHRARRIEDVLGYGRTDLLSYRADAPQSLAVRQAKAWDPHLDWVAEAFGARLNVSAGIAYVEQPAESLAAFAAVIGGLDDWTLVAVHGAAAILGSLVLALALAEGRLGAADAFALSRLDEAFQNEAWGRDAEAEARAARLERELQAMERFLRLARP